MTEQDGGGVGATLPEIERQMVGWAEEAAEIAREQFLHTGKLRFKHAREAVTETDREIETLLTQRIRTAFPGDAVFGEEFGPDASIAADARRDRPPGRIWHLDPIDGTLNFAVGLPNFCTSIALMEGDTILAACVYAPLHREGFSASRGAGCRLNGLPLQVSDRPTLPDAIISAQLQKGGRYVQNAELLKAILLRSMKMRRLGTIALEMAYLAAGRFDAMIAGRGRPQQLYDVAAGILLVQEAGGRVTDHHGRAYVPYSTDLVASNALVHDELIRLIAEFEPGS
ncbi:MAG: inositol monophosphatase [Candidatus Krumholzibacteriia bacterium]